MKLATHLWTDPSLFSVWKSPTDVHSKHMSQIA